MKAKNITIVLDNIRSRENVGSIFRTADGAGVTKIYLCGITPTPEVGSPKFEYRNSKQILNSKFQIQNSDKIAKTALGAEKWVPWEYRAKTWQVLRELKVKSLKHAPYGSEASCSGFKVVGLERFDKLTASKLKIRQKNIFKYKVPKNKKIALVVGNEVKGLSPKILKYCDDVVHIPMYGRKESLNVAVAAGVALYVLTNRG